MQVENAERSLGAEHPLLITNKQSSFFGFMWKKSNPEMYNQIVDVVTKHGWKGRMAFFYAIVEKTETGNNNVSHSVKINLSRVLPVESW